MKIELRVSLVKVEAWDDLEIYQNCGDSEGKIQEVGYICGIRSDSISVDGEDIPFDSIKIEESDYVEDRCIKYKYVYVGFAKKHWMEAEIDEDEFDISKLKIVKSKLILPPSSYLDTECDIFSIYYEDKELFDRDAPWNCEDPEEFDWDEYNELWDAEYEDDYAQEYKGEFCLVDEFMSDDNMEEYLKEEGFIDED